MHTFILNYSILSKTFFQYVIINTFFAASMMEGAHVLAVRLSMTLAIVASAGLPTTMARAPVIPNSANGHAKENITH